MLQTHLTNLMAQQNDVHRCQLECQSVFHLSSSVLHVLLIDMLVGRWELSSEYESETQVQMEAEHPHNVLLTGGF